MTHDTRERAPGGLARRPCPSGGAPARGRRLAPRFAAGRDATRLNARHTDLRFFGGRPALRLAEGASGEQQSGFQVLSDFFQAVAAGIDGAFGLRAGRAELGGERGVLFGKATGSASAPYRNACRPSRDRIGRSAAVRLQGC